jgi:RimJ/RimL family protein N-acetyltransferase
MPAKRNVQGLSGAREFHDRSIVKSGFMHEIRLLAPNEWLTLRDVRLAALLDSPGTFLSTHARERLYEDRHWRAEFDRGDWYVGFVDGTPVSLVGVTRDADTPDEARYFEYLWVAPGHQRRGVALRMIQVALDRLSVDGIRTVFLWVLDGNQVALRVYERAGFVRTNRSHPVEDRPGRTEELLRLDLG